MLEVTDRVNSFSKLGEWLGKELDAVKEGKENSLEEILRKTHDQNNWFTRESVLRSLRALNSWLQKDKLDDWVSYYHIGNPANQKVVAIIMAGNIPLVNFHDLLGVLISGNKVLVKLSKQDSVLLPFLMEKLVAIETQWSGQITFTEEKLIDFDAVIATGSNNTSRYFEHYFGKYPHIIRKNRSSIGIIEPDMPKDDLRSFYNDIFDYYGLGCRNISFLMLPEKFEWDEFHNAWEGLENPLAHHKYKNNYDYYKSFYLVNKQPFIDLGMVMLTEGDQLSTSISVISYAYYKNEEEITNFIMQRQDEIQCVVSKKNYGNFATIQPGQSQYPGLMDYPDNVDIIQFLLAL